MGIRRQISFTKSNSGQLMNCKVKIFSKSFYSPSLKDVVGLESVQLRFFNFSIYLSIIFPANRVNLYT